MGRHVRGRKSSRPEALRRVTAPLVAWPGEGGVCVWQSKGSVSPGGCPSPQADPKAQTEAGLAQRTCRPPSDSKQQPQAPPNGCGRDTLTPRLNTLWARLARQRNRGCGTESMPPTPARASALTFPCKAVSARNWRKGGSWLGRSRWACLKTGGTYQTLTLSGPAPRLALPSRPAAGAQGERKPALRC